jgi:hypothetical protein
VRQICRIGTLALLGLLFAINVYRAATQSITHDEALTYELFVGAPWSVVFNSFDANHHVLHTIVCKILVGVLGLSTLSLRLASLLGGLLYFWAVFRTCERLFDASWYLPLSVGLLTLNPYLLDFLSAARGYGMAVAFLMLAFWEMLQWVANPRNPHLLRAGLALGLSVAANLVLAPPGIGLALMFLLAIAYRRRTFQPDITVSKKGKKKASPNPYPTLSQALLRFVLPSVGTAWLILMYPLSNAAREQFYVGAASLGQASESLVRDSLPLAPRVLIAALAYVVIPALLIAAAVIAWRALSRWTQATLLEKSTLLVGGAMLVAFLSLVTAHLAADVPYPEGRTGIYWLPMLTLSGLTIAKLWKRATPFLAVAMAGCMAMFIAEFRVTYYADWPYDADTQAIAGQILSRKPTVPGRKILVEGSWQLEPGLNFYRVRDHMEWMAEVERREPKAGADYYVLLSQDAHFLDELHLKTLLKGARSGTILAQP